MAAELDPLEEHLLAALRALEPSAALRAAPPEAEALWRAQVDSRQADYAARWLQQHGRSFYTIGSAGHESNAAVALALRVDDPALLHYRSGAFYLARAAQAGIDGAARRHARRRRRGRRADRRRPAQGLRAARARGHPDDLDDRVAPARGRSGWRSRSTARARLGVDRARGSADAVVLCSFGDASLNHATAQAALNTTAQIAYQGLPLPLLFVCEDNGLGISVPHPARLGRVAR